MNLTHQERIQRALKAKEAAETKLKKLADADTKRKVDRLAKLANKTGLLEFSDEILLPELKALVARLESSGSALCEVAA